jgi:hypothetical protein
MEINIIELLNQIKLTQELASTYGCDAHDRFPLLNISVPTFDAGVGDVISISIHITDIGSNLGYRTFDISVVVAENDNLLDILIPAIFRLREFIKGSMGK